MERRYQLVFLVVATLILFGAGYKYAQVKAGDLAGAESLVADIEESNSDDQKDTGNGKEEEPKEVVVHVAGEVERPGVLHLPSGSRVIDAVNMAGPTKNSALDYLNLAAPLHDGIQIMVLNKENIDSPPAPTGVGSDTTGSSAPAQPIAGAVGSSGLININTAGQAEIEKLPGIGPTMAQRIVDHRTKNGLFLSPQDIMSVSGIGEKRFEQIKNLICVN